MKLVPVSKIIQPNPRYDNQKVLSWSDIVSIEAGRYPQSIPPTRAMLFGTYIHKLIEEDKLPIAVPRGIHHEKKVKFGCFVGRIDSYDKNIIIDYKTANKHWSRSKAEKHGQLIYYAYLLWKDKGIKIKKYKIVSLQTGWSENEELIIVGTPRVHTKDISMIDILKAKARADRALLKLRKVASSA